MHIYICLLDNFALMHFSSISARSIVPWAPVRLCFCMLTVVRKFMDMHDMLLQHDAEGPKFSQKIHGIWACHRFESLAWNCTEWCAPRKNLWDFEGTGHFCCYFIAQHSIQLDAFVQHKVNLVLEIISAFC